MRTNISWCLLLLLFLGCTASRQAKQTTSPLVVKIIQTNDVYEIGTLEGGRVGGMARLATLSKEIRKANPHTFSVLVGDFLNPSVMGLAKIDGERVRGRQMVDMMNEVGIDWVVFGNHEFDLPYEDLQKRINESQFEWISGNVYQVVDGEAVAFAKVQGQKREPLPRYAIWEIPVGNSSSIKIGVLGVCLDMNQPAYVHYEDVFESAKRDFDTLSQQTDFVIGLTHLEIADDRKLAQQLPGLKLIMGGHDHNNMREVIGTVPVTKADANAKTAYIHTLTIDPSSRKVKVNSELRALDESIGLDSDIQQKVENWEKQAYQSFEEQGLPISESIVALPEPLDGLESHIRFQPTNLGTALAQAMMNTEEGIDCAFLNSGSIRIDDYLQGTITFFDLIRAMPYGGEIWIVELTGELLVKVLDAGKGNRGTGGYLQTAGIKQLENRWFVHDQQIEPDKVYTVATSAFLMQGREIDLEFLTPDHPSVKEIDRPTAEDIRRDIRLVLAEYLKGK